MTIIINTPPENWKAIINVILTNIFDDDSQENVKFATGFSIGDCTLFPKFFNFE